VGRKSREKWHRRVVKEQEKLDRMREAIRHTEARTLSCECGKVWRNVQHGVWAVVKDGNPEHHHRILEMGRGMFAV
jgi:hypothetical protein